MATYIAFLRAVNVGNRKYLMAELRAALTSAGFTDVETHIQTGNARFRTSLRSRPKIVAALEQAMLADRGFEVPVILLSPAELVAAEAEARDFAAALGAPVQSHYLTLLAAPAAETTRTALEARSTPDEMVRVGERAVHLLLTKPYHEAALGNAVVERHAGVATTRNLTVIRKLTEKWGT